MRSLSLTVFLSLFTAQYSACWAICMNFSTSWISVGMCFRCVLVGYFCCGVCACALV